MIIEGMVLKKFRNYSNLEFELSPGFNCITGENGAGKSNILEAIGLLSTLKSFRGATDADMMQWGSPSFFCSATTGGEPSSFEIGYISEGSIVRKRLKIDAGQVRRASDFYGRLPSVIFSPLDISIVNDGPEIRRRFFDSALAKMDPAFIRTYAEFRRVLQSRNRVLRDIRNRNARESSLEVWDELFADTGWQITEARRNFLDVFVERFRPVYGAIADDEAPVIRYMTSWRGGSREELRSAISAMRGREVRMGMTCLGPQRDDYLILKSRDVSFDSSASQGQRRMAAISMRLAEAGILEETRGEPPVVLIDDVFSELDSRRRRNLVEHLGGKSQIIFTMVDSDHAEGLDGALFFVAENGTLRRK